MTILRVGSLDDILSFEKASDGKISANHTTTVNGIPEGYNDQILDMNGASIRYFAGRILGGINVPRATIEKKTPDTTRKGWMSKWHGPIMDYVPMIGVKQALSKLDQYRLYRADPTNDDETNEMLDMLILKLEGDEDNEEEE